MIQVDIDKSEILGRARQQGMRPTCLAFAASDLNAFSHSTGQLSVEYVCHHSAKLAVDWEPSQGFTTAAVLDAIANPGQPAEDSYPYLVDEHDAPLRPPVGVAGPLYTSIKRSRHLTYADVLKHVQAGEAVGVVMAVTESLYYPKDGVIAFDPLVIPDLYHALVVVGVGTHTLLGEKHLLIRNSWGVDWGIRGHAWVSERHVALHLIEGFLV